MSYDKNIFPMVMPRKSSGDADHASQVIRRHLSCLASSPGALVRASSVKTNVRHGRATREDVIHHQYKDVDDDYCNATKDDYADVYEEISDEDASRPS